MNKVGASIGFPLDDDGARLHAVRRRRLPSAHHEGRRVARRQGVAWHVLLRGVALRWNWPLVNYPK